MTKEITKTTTVPEIVSDNKLVRFVETVTEKDLQGLRAEIVTTENRLRGMKKLESVIATALGKVQPKPSHKAKIAKQGESLNDKRRRIAILLSNNPRNGSEIVTLCGIQPAQLKEVMTCEYFQESNQGWHLTTAGRRAFC